MKFWVDLKRMIYRLRKIKMRRVDIKGMICRLKNRRLEDAYAVDDALDLLCYIDNSYSDEIPYLVECLVDSDDDEVMNFIICILKIMSNTLNEKLISILDSKIDIIIYKDNEDYYTTLYYIFDYFSLQGKQHQEMIKPLLLKIISCNIPCCIRQEAFSILNKM